MFKSDYTLVTVIVYIAIFLQLLLFFLDIVKAAKVQPLFKDHTYMLTYIVTFILRVSLLSGYINLTKSKDPIDKRIRIFVFLGYFTTIGLICMIFMYYSTKSFIFWMIKKLKKDIKAKKSAASLLKITSELESVDDIDKQYDSKIENIDV